MSIPLRFSHYLPGLLMSAAVALAAFAAERAEFLLLGDRWVGSIVLAIAFGIVVATWRPLTSRFRPGIDLSAKGLLEVAIVLLGASVSYEAVRTAGLELIAGIAAVVLLSICTTFAIGRLLGLTPKLAMLIACGNSICGNSAIVAVAPVIEAKAEDVTSALAFTAGLGILAVFLLPLLYHHSGLSVSQYGVVAGISVYAVPQVLAATAPIGILSVQIGTLVKLIRVLMLGPVILLLGLVMKMRSGGIGDEIGKPIIPWFILGFFAMIALQVAGLISDTQAGAMAFAASLLTTLAMAALGLSVDLRAFLSAGGRVMLAATLSLVLLTLMGLLLIWLAPPL